MNMKFTAGELAKLNEISKQTLIYYDNIDLFKPNIVDKNNNYRYYTSDQLEVLDSILLLREIGISIKDIKSFLIDRDDNKALDLLKNQKQKLHQQLKNIQTTIKKLENKIDLIENLDLQENDVLFTDMDLEYLVLEKVDYPYQLFQTDVALKKLINNAHAKKYPYNYQLGTIVTIENLLSKNFTLASYVFLPLYEKFNSENIYTKAKGTYAVALHKGEYATIGNTYEYIIDKINENNYKISGASFEYCILDSFTSYSSKDYITKITIPVEKL